MLEVQDLHAYYGKSHILQGVDMYIDTDEVVSLLGRNGVGRSTTVKAIMGEVPPQGSIKFKGVGLGSAFNTKWSFLYSAGFWMAAATARRWVARS